MKRFLLCLVALCISLSGIYSQTAPQNFKKVNKSKVPYTTSFKPYLPNAQGGLKSASPGISNMMYRNIGKKALVVSVKDQKIILGPDSITPVFFERKIDSHLKSAQIQDPQARCKFFLESIAADLKIAHPSECFYISHVDSDTSGFQHIRLGQRYKGIKVYASDFYVHFSDKKEVLNGHYSIIPDNLNTKPGITEKQALDMALTDLQKYTPITELPEIQRKELDYNGPSVDTVILEDKKSFSKYILAYHVRIRPNLIDHWYYFVNAANGEIIKKYNTTCEDGPATAVAKDLNGQNRQINTYLEKGKYYLMDIAEPMFNAQNSSGFILTADGLNSSTNNFKYADITSSNNVWDNPIAVSAHFNANQAYLYYKNTFSRNSIDGNGGNIISFINIRNSDGSGLDNAFWNTKYMFYGNGNVAFSSLAGGLDVAAHEMTHGVTQNSAALEYEGQSGAINESMSDVFGAMVDRSNWYIGESVTKTSYIPTGRLRDMSNPHNGASTGGNGWQPMHVSEMYVGTEDNGGVHINSGICNYAYYLLATAITKEKAEKIYYRVLTHYLTKSSQFIDLRIAVIQSAKDLYGDTSNEATQAGKAFDAVGIYSEQPVNTSGNEYPANPGQEYLMVYNTSASDANTIYRSNTTATVVDAITQTVAKGKVSVTDNGKVAAFVSTDDNIRAISTDPASPSEVVISSDAIWENVAVSRDGNRMAAITTSVDTAIYIYDFESENWAKFHLYIPTTEGNIKSSGVLYADAMEFDHTGEYLVYDSYNVFKSASGDSLSYWDIGLIRVWDNQKHQFGDGTIVKLFSDIPDSVSIGNPVFSKNSPNIIAFDYLNGENINAVLGLNLETSTLNVIATDNTVGYPSFSRLDDKIAYSSLGTGDVEQVMLVDLNADKISPKGTPASLFTEARWPVFFATGTRVLGFAPVAAFTVSYPAGNSPLSVKFFDQSANEPTSWLWTFDSGTPNTSTSQNPEVTYNTPGTYSVTLKVTNGYGNNSITKTGYIVVSKATGIAEAKNTLLLYPNPVKDVLVIQGLENSGLHSRVDIYSSDGRLLKTCLTQSKVSVGDLNAGIYILKVNTNGEIVTLKILKE